MIHSPVTELFTDPQVTRRRVTRAEFRGGAVCGSVQPTCHPSASCRPHVSPAHLRWADAPMTHWLRRECKICGAWREVILWLPAPETWLDCDVAAPECRRLEANWTNMVNENKDSSCSVYSWRSVLSWKRTIFIGGNKRCMLYGYYWVGDTILNIHQVGSYY